MLRSRSHGGRTGTLVAGITLLMLGAGCDQENASQGQAQKKDAPPAVTVSQPVQREITEWDEYSGRFDAVETVEMRARVSGHLSEVRFRDGQVVKRGDVLFVIDQRPFERALEQARAEMFAATTKVENANLDIVRGKPLVERKIISDKDFDDRMSIIRNAQAAAKVAEAKVNSAELDLSFTTIDSPITGRISRTLVTAGNWVSAGGMGDATLLTIIVSQDPIYAYFDVTENNYIKYKRSAERGVGSGAAGLGPAVEIGLLDERGFPHKARLDFLDNRLDRGTATLRARAVLANPGDLFSPGLFARVRVTSMGPHLAVLLTDEAIGTEQSGKFVYVVGEDGIVVRRNVELGPVYGDLRVVREGITVDEWVIIRGLQRAHPGDKVTPNRKSSTLSEVPDAKPIVKMQE